MKTFQGHGISFQYPPSWDLVREVGSDRIDIAVHGPGTAMWVLSVLQHRPDTEETVKEVVGSYLDEYSTCDVYNAEEAICLMPTVSKDIDFFSQDFITHVHVRACEGETESLLLIYQIADIDGGESYDILRAMTDSLVFQSFDDDEDDDSDIPANRYHNLFADPSLIDPVVTDEDVRQAEWNMGVTPDSPIDDDDEADDKAADPDVGDDDVD